MWGDDLLQPLPVETLLRHVIEAEIQPGTVVIAIAIMALVQTVMLGLILWRIW